MPVDNYEDQRVSNQAGQQHDGEGDNFHDLDWQRIIRIVTCEVVLERLSVVDICRRVDRRYLFH